jgi:predicted DNA binding CopG/RHH family protein
MYVCLYIDDIIADYMKKKIIYTNEKIGKVEVVKDFLPKPEDLVFKEDNVKVTINLSKSSLDFFKKLAKQHGSQYQKVIRNLLDSYSSFYSRTQ